MKKSFILYLDQYEPIKNLSDNEKGILFNAIFTYQFGGNPVFDDNPVIEMAFNFFKQTFERDNGKYENICERNRINGLKGGRPKNPKNPLGSLVTQDNPKEPKKADSDSDNDSD